MSNGEYGERNVRVFWCDVCRLPGRCIMEIEQPVLATRWETTQ
jgi:hypothetical protein